MRREEVLAYEARRRLYLLISREPGLHLRELERNSGMPLSTLRYHLAYLERHRIVEAEEDKYYRRYFVLRDLAPADRRLVAALRQDALRRVVLHVLASGGSVAYKDLREAFQVPASTLAVHLSELTRGGVLARHPVGRESVYEVVDGEKVIRVLHTYRHSFLDKMVDNLLAAIYQEEPPDDDDEAPPSQP